MPVKPPINFKKWIKEHRNLLKPPVGNRVVYDEGDLMIMVVGGPNSRKDYHVDTVEEFFYQLEGDMLLKIMEDGKRVDVPIKEGEIFLLPKNVPHSPQRFENTVGLVVEYQREEGALDTFQWYCDGCDSLLYEAKLDLEDIVAQLPPIFKKYWNDLNARTCAKCGAVQDPPQ
ncbi:MAG: 3-hydroxyanthranilate 3,4-dioxygenase [Candidatus Marinimicrobia bacterium]|uniref:3-hydroxyanthranilate 3,4 dioxygenase (HAAO) n=1 Tax=uncultured marine group II/III euryarchaeote KM3_76_C12 TaxID=1456506 RepID=A0A075HMS2_9EURY|nr:3-hydroxyanthranilate 3,4 dioxygenase (HAAO) [uncultured marine group II/III euryarchaeote KM3_76_C12]MEA1882842.1 3-hydroxyanthranilate 3,4-dioxygenase [Candidatus Neomarinimicrobiota bacterium]